MRGSIVKRGKSYSYVFALEADHEGKRRQRWVGGFRTKKEAEAGLAEALGRVQAGTYSDAGRQTVREFCEQWIESVASSLAPSTVSDYRRIIQGTHLGQRIGNRRGRRSNRVARMRDRDRLPDLRGNGHEPKADHTRKPHRLLRTVL